MSLPKQLSTKAAVQKLIWNMAAYNSTIGFPLELSEFGAPQKRKTSSQSVLTCLQSTWK